MLCVRKINSLESQNDRTSRKTKIFYVPSPHPAVVPIPFLVPSSLLLARWLGQRAWLTVFYQSIAILLSRGPATPRLQHPFLVFYVWPPSSDGGLPLLLGRTLPEKQRMTGVSKPIFFAVLSGFVDNPPEEDECLSCTGTQLIYGDISTHARSSNRSSWLLAPTLLYPLSNGARGMWPTCVYRVDCCRILLNDVLLLASLSETLLLTRNVTWENKKVIHETPFIPWWKMEFAARRPGGSHSYVRRFGWTAGLAIICIRAKSTSRLESTLSLQGGGASSRCPPVDSRRQHGIQGSTGFLI